MSLDASTLLDKLTRVHLHKVTGSCIMTMETFSRGYSKMAPYLMGEGGGLMMQAVMICIISLKGSPHSRKRESSYLSPRNNRKPERPNYFNVRLIGGI
jgi:hypothetical protein